MKVFIMTAEEYKRAKAILVPRNKDMWLLFCSISEDQDKAYSSGRTPIPTMKDTDKATIPLAEYLSNLVKDKKERIINLRDKIQSIFPASKLEIDNETFDIFDKESSLYLKNAGQDWFHQDIIYISMHHNRHKITNIIAYCNLYGQKWDWVILSSDRLKRLEISLPNLQTQQFYDRDLNEQIIKNCS